MAHFRGTVQGNRGEASRLGSKKSGLQTTAASWQGDICVWLYHCEDCGGQDRYTVEKVDKHGKHELLAQGVL